MNKTIETLCESLEDLGEAVEKGWTDDRTLNAAFGWNCPSINRHELAFLARSLAKRIRNADLEIEDQVTLELLDSVPTKLTEIKTKTVPYFYNGNGTTAVPAYIATLDWISSIIEPELSWVISNDPKAMPPAISRRLKSLKLKINDIDIDQNKLSDQINLINEATETAESLPADLQDLKEARKKVEKIGTEAVKTNSKITAAKEDSDTFLESIKLNKEETDKLVDNCEDAYRITTSKGLAGAFDTKASQLTTSMWVWVVGLLISLGGAWYVGSERIVMLTRTMSVDNPQWGIILMHLLLAVVSVGAPLWFAWLSTKQIGQRFKLAEDYGYKASVAKAYEGYRKEASRVDEKLQARLFDSALTRLEEAPLRLVEKESHGSPWHELSESAGFKQALDNIPEFRERIFGLAENAINKTKSKSKPKPVKTTTTTSKTKQTSS